MARVNILDLTPPPHQYIGGRKLIVRNDLEIGNIIVPHAIERELPSFETPPTIGPRPGPQPYMKFDWTRKSDIKYLAGFIWSQLPQGDGGYESGTTSVAGVRG